MFYDGVRNAHGLAHDPLKALVVPRPIGWISSLAPNGTRNLAPYSFFNAIGERPAYVMFASGGRKDSLRNIEATGEFVCSLATWELREAMNASSAMVPEDVDEFELAGLEAAPSEMVRPERVAASPVSLECTYWQTIELPGLEPGTAGYSVIIGKIVGVHIDDALIVEGLVDITRARPIARLGYRDYCVVDEVFQMERPGGA